MVFSKMMDFISIFDRQYKLMTNFAAIMETLNEKKSILIKNNPNRAGEILDRISSKPIVNLGQYIFQKKAGYIVVKQVLEYKRSYSENPIDVPTTKRQKFEVEKSFGVEIYSPS